MGRNSKRPTQIGLSKTSNGSKPALLNLPNLLRWPKTMCKHGKCCSIRNAELLISIMKVNFYRSLGDASLSRDLFVGQAGGHKLSDFLLTYRKKFRNPFAVVPARSFPLKCRCDQFT